MGGWLYQVDKPMRDNDYHTKIIDSLNDQTMFLGILPDGPAPTEYKSTWPVKPFPVLANPKANDGSDRTDFGDAKAPLTMEGVIELFESAGYKVTWVADKMRVIKQSTTLGKEYQMALDARDFALSIERILMSNQECVVGSKATPYLTRGLFNWLKSAAHAVSGVTEVPEKLRPTAAQNYSGKMTDLTESAFKDMLAACYKQKRGKVSLVGYCGINLKQKMSTWSERVETETGTEAVRRSVQTLKNAIALMVDTFTYDSGTVRTVLQPNLNCDLTSATLEDTASSTTAAGSDDCGAFIDLKMWQMGWFQRIIHVPGDTITGGAKGFHRAAGRLECLNPMGQMSIMPVAAA